MQTYVEQSDILKDVVPESLVNFAPVVTVIRGYTLRTANGGFAYWGQGCWIVPRSGELVIASVSLDKLVDKYGLSSMDAFESAMASRLITRIQWPVAFVRQGEAVYVPFGQVPLVTTASELASFVVVPWISKELANRAGTCVGELLFANFGKYLKSAGTKSPWKEVVAPWKAYRAAME